MVEPLGVKQETVLPESSPGGNGVPDVNKRMDVAPETPKKVETKQPAGGDSPKTAEKGTVGFDDPKHPQHARFQELLDKSKAEKERADLLETQVNDINAQLAEQKQPKVDELSEDLVSVGMDESRAKDFIGKIEKRLEAKYDTRLKSIENQSQVSAQQAKINQKLSEFKALHSDFSDYEADMTKMYKALSPKLQSELAMDLGGIDMLYKAAKDNKAEPGQTQSKTGKIAGKSSPKTSFGAKFSRTKIGDMNLDEYRQYQKEILAAQSRGEVEEE